MSVPEIWLAMIARNVTLMRTLLMSNSSNANAPHPRSGGLPLDSALYWGYLPESQVLYEFGGKTVNSPLASAVMLGNIELLNWVYDTMDKNVNNISIPGAVFASTQTSDLHKYQAFQFMLNKGSDYHAYVFNAVILSPLATKYLVENNMLDLSSNAGNNRTLLDEIELRNMVNPYALYLKPDKSNEIFVAITNNDLVTLQNTTNNVNTVLSNFVGTPYLYALSLGRVDAAKILISKGALTTYTTPSGQNAIASAIFSNSVDAVNLARDGLSEDAIDVVYKNKRNMQVTVLQSAVARCISTEVFISLLKPHNGKRGANPDLLCDGVPAAGTIGYVIRAPDYPFNNHTDMFKALVDAGSNVDMYNSVMRNNPRGHYLTQLKQKGVSQEIINEITNYKLK